MKQMLKMHYACLISEGIGISFFLNKRKNRPDAISCTTIRRECHIFFSKRGRQYQDEPMEHPSAQTLSKITPVDRPAVFCF